MDSRPSPATPLRSTSSALLFCRMCQAVYRQPKLLPCLHSFCKICLTDVVTFGADGAAIVCPLCSHRTTLSSGGVNDLQDNCFLSRMCQEYISEVQSHIVARSLYPSSDRRSSEFTELRSKLTEELSQGRCSPSHSQVPHQGFHPMLREAHPVSTSHQDSSPGQPTLETIHNTGRLQSKIMALQGEALRVTYAIDHVNQCMVEWHQHKEDLKMAVQRRSAQFQFFFKRMEHQLMTQIDGKHVDDEFYAESDKSKNELRKVLKKILHEVSVLKNIQELGNDSEINILSSGLLGKSVGMTDVTLKKLQFEMNVPTQSIEEIVADWFGMIRLNPVDVNVFAPDVVDFTNISIVDENNDQDLSVYEGDREAFNVEDGHKTSSRSYSDSSAVRYHDEDLDKEDVREHLVQFQNVRETLRSRRREILTLGQQAREGSSAFMDESHRHTRSAMRKGRVQSLDRIAASELKENHRREITKKYTVDNISREDKERSPKDGSASTNHDLAFNLLYITGDSNYMHRSIPEDIHVPSPVIEEVSLLQTPQRKLVKQTSDPHSTLSSLEATPDSKTAIPTHSQSATEYINNVVKSGSPFRGRRHSSDQYAFSSHGRGVYVDLSQDSNPTRQVRRAISGVADRKTKIDFLRENWQKRKEILIQSEGFVSPHSNVKHGARSEDDSNYQTAANASSVDNDASKQQEVCSADVEAEPAYIHSHQHFKRTNIKSDEMNQTTVNSRYSDQASLTKTDQITTSDFVSHTPTQTLTSIQPSSQHLHEIRNHKTTAELLPKSPPNMTNRIIEQSDMTSFTPASSHKLEPSTLQSENRTYTTTATESVLQPGSPESYYYKRMPFILPSRHQEDPTRRYTDDVGKVATKTDAFSKSCISQFNESALNPLHSRSVEHFNISGSRDNDTESPALAESTSSENITHAKLGTKDRAFRHKPSPLQFMQDQSGTSDETSRSPRHPSSPQPPSSPTPIDGVHKVRLRELTRKKKERWRHLTIH